MRCLILAAGYATRLYPLTENFPKPLLKVGDRSILDRLVDDVAPAVESFTVVTNHRFAGHFEAWAAGRPEAITVVDDGTMDNENRLGAVRDIVLGLEGNTDDVLIMAGDNVLDFSLTRFTDFFREKKASCVMTFEEKRLEKQRKTAIITFDGAGRITSYEEKPQNPKGCHAVPPFYCYTAVDAARAEEALAEGCPADAPGSFAAWLAGKTQLYAFEMPGLRYDIGDAESYRQVQENYRGIIR